MINRSERLPVIKERIADGRLFIAADLAAALAVSLRTVYRDIAALRSTGVKIMGEPGIGYMLRPDLPWVRQRMHRIANEARASQ
jgi:predicted DNA-binding transcriptional regulator YafY